MKELSSKVPKKNVLYVFAGLILFTLLLHFSYQFFRQQPCLSRKLENSTNDLNPNQDTPTLFYHNMSIFSLSLKKMIQDKPVYMQIGSLGEGARSPDTFWIEFDPQDIFKLDQTRITFPFAVTASNIREIFFYRHKYDGCSSTAQCSNLVETESEYMELSSAVCNAYIARTGHVNPPSASSACFSCQNVNDQQAPETVLAVSIAQVIQEILPLTHNMQIESLVIDAQGRDSELIFSLGDLIHSIKNVKLECQNSLYLYETSVVNNCDNMQKYLQERGFTVSSEINNCACDEYNLIAHK